MPQKHIWGIDIGSSSVRAVKLVRTQDSIKLADYDIRELSYLGREDERILEAVRKALIGLAGRKSLIGEKVFISIPGAVCFQRIVKIPPCPLSKVPELMKYEAQQQIPFKLNEVVWDYQLVSSPEDVSEGRRVVLFAVKRSVLEPILRFCKEAMMRVVGIQASHLALFNYLKWELNIDKPIGILDVGARYTEFALFDVGGGNELWVRPIPVSGSHFTEMVAERKRSSFLEAEQEKISSLILGGDVLQQIKPAIANISGEVSRSVGFFKTQTAGREPSKIFLAGRALSFPGGISALQTSVGASVVEVNYPQKIAYSLVGAAEVFFEDCKQLNVAFGLALQGLDEVYFNTNLLPKEKQLDNILADKKVPVAIALSLLWAALLIAYFMASSRVTTAKTNLSTIKKAVEQISSDEAQYNSILEKIPAKIRLMENLSSYAAGRDVPLIVLNKINDSVAAVRADGGSIWISALDLYDDTRAKLDEWALSLNLPTVTSFDQVITWKAGTFSPTPEEQKIFDMLEPSLRPRWYTLVLAGEALAGEGAEKLKMVERLRNELAKNAPLFKDVTISTDWKEVELVSGEKKAIAIEFSIRALIDIPPLSTREKPEQDDEIGEAIR